VKEPNKNHDIWVSDSVQFFTGFLHISGSGLIWLLAKPGFWFGLFLLDSGSFSSVVKPSAVSQPNSEREMSTCSVAVRESASH